MSYDKLLLATGSRVRRLSTEGVDLAGVRYLRSLADPDELRDRLRTAGQFVVVGGGWIGLETAAAARRYGADVAVVGVGIEPEVELAAAAGIAVANGVLADASLRTSDPDVFAAGDVANSENPLLGRRIRVEHWANARHGGRAAARAMLGAEVSYDQVPYFFSDQYDSSPIMGMEYTGWVGPGDYDQVIFRGDPRVTPTSDPAFLAFWLKDGRGAGRDERQHLGRAEADSGPGPRRLHRRRRGPDQARRPAGAAVRPELTRVPRVEG